VPAVGDLTEAELRAWGEALGRALVAPAFLTLTGDLGAGKTTLAAAILRGAGVSEAVTSPTYAVVQRYTTTAGVPVYHADLYRLRGPHELAAIGWEELLASPGIVLVEWPERAGALLPADRRDIAVAHLPGDPARRRLIA
jgi:tRNA threonylcarbamoyladenosine biosynthesis protein TsaE